MTKAPASPSKPKPKPSTKPKPKPKTTKPKPKCKLCDKTLVPLADRRKGGTRRHNDWDARPYHKKCWKLLHRRQYAPRPRWSAFVR
jgi:hypothetical protein